MEVDLDGRVTVILGANDHGKSNVLGAIQHLNPDEPFDHERDLNWDCLGKPNECPSISYKLSLSLQERQELAQIINSAQGMDAVKRFRDEMDAQLVAEEEATAAENAELEAKHAEVASLQERLGGLEEASERASVQGAIDEGEAALAASASAPEEFQARLTLARNRAALAHATVLTQEAAIRGDDTFDLQASAVDAQARAESLSSQLANDEAEIQAAQQAVTQAVEQHGDGSAPHAEATAAEAAANEKVQAKRVATEEAASEWATIRDAAEARRLADEGELAFAKGQAPPKSKLLKATDVPELMMVGRTGVVGELKLQPPEGIPSEMAWTFIQQHLPRVELIESKGKLVDSVTAESLIAEENDFMRGIFRYAELPTDEWQSIFEQTHQTMRRLDVAEQALNSTLRANWSQGKELTFRFAHKEGAIELGLDDPAVKGQRVPVSRRSSGFTHFFSLKTMLFSREQESNASSFVWLFDEPGTSLHPEAQQDLLQVLETLGQSNQIVYSTHSIFLVNKNHPTRHRLLKKEALGTTIDKKPYAGRWRAAIDALGFAFPGTILFAPHVLLVEGDSDPILLYADLQKLLELSELDIDLNSLSIMSTGDSKHADALIRFLLGAYPPPQVALLFDSDGGGLQRRKSLAALIKTHDLKHDLLEPENTETEDHLLAPDLYLEAVINYMAALVPAKIKETVRPTLEASWQQRDEKAGTWAQEQGALLLAGDPPSKVGLAREYSTLLEEADVVVIPKRTRQTRSVILAKKIRDMLDIPAQTTTPGAILDL